MIGAFAILSQKKREKELLIPDIVKGLLCLNPLLPSKCSDTKELIIAPT